MIEKADGLKTFQVIGMKGWQSADGPGNIRFRSYELSQDMKEVLLLFGEVIPDGVFQGSGKHGLLGVEIFRNGFLETPVGDIAKVQNACDERCAWQQPLPTAQFSHHYGETPKPPSPAKRRLLIASNAQANHLYLYIATCVSLSTFGTASGKAFEPRSRHQLYK
jgi:hypothetical protein